MKKATLFIICLGAFSLNGAAQQLRFSDIYTYGGSGSTVTGPLNTQEINQLQSGMNTPIVQDTYFGYGYNQYRYSNQVGMMAAWDFIRRPERNQKLRLGFSAGTYQLNFESYRSEYATYRIDTLTSDRTGRTTYIDSTFTRNLYHHHNAQMFNVNIDYLRGLNPQNKLSFYAGAGLNLGVSFSNSITATYTESSYTNAPDDYNYYGPQYYGMNNSYVFKNYSKDLSPAVNIRPYSLVGMNYRLSNRSPLLKYMNLFAELKMGIDINTMQEIDPSVGYYYCIQSGLRVSFNPPKTRR